MEVRTPSKDGESTLVQGYERYTSAECLKERCAAWKDGRCAYSKG